MSNLIKKIVLTLCCVILTALCNVLYSVRSAMMYYFLHCVFVLYACCALQCTQAAAHWMCCAVLCSAVQQLQCAVCSTLLCCVMFYSAVLHVSSCAVLCCAMFQAVLCCAMCCAVLWSLRVALCRACRSSTHGSVHTDNQLFSLIYVCVSACVCVYVCGHAQAWLGMFGRVHGTQNALSAQQIVQRHTAHRDSTQHSSTHGNTQHSKRDVHSIASQAVYWTDKWMPSVTKKSTPIAYKSAAAKNTQHSSHILCDSENIRVISFFANTCNPAITSHG